MFKNYREEQEKANERNLLEAKINDKYKFAISKNKITNTDFLNLHERSITEKFLKENHIKNYIFFGGNGEESERNILIFYPEKFSKDMVEKNYCKIVSAIKIELPKQNSYEHRIFLSGLMKLGIKREKIGDILVNENGAEIIVLSDVAEFLKNNLQDLTRFRGANIEIININEVQKKKIEFQEINMIVSSMRLDNFVTEICHCSRSKAEQIIVEQIVFVNYNLELRVSKKIEINDVINVRGKGKFIVDRISHQTKNGKYVVIMKKYM